jgi:hypothetical protein
VPILAKTVRGTWLLAGAVWLTLCGVAWSVLPVRPRTVISVDDRLLWFRLSPDGRYCAVFTHHGPKDASTLRVWDAWTGSPVANMPALRYDDRWLQGFLFTPGGSELLVPENAPASPAYQLWDLRTGSVRTPGLPQKMEGSHMVFAPGGDLLAVTTARDSSDHRVRLLEFPSLRTRAELAGARTPLAFSPDGRLIVTTPDGKVGGGAADGRVIVTTPDERQDRGVSLDVWDVAAVRKLASFQTGYRIYQFQFSPDGRWFVTSSARPKPGGGLHESFWPPTQVWDVRSGQEMMAVDGSQLHITGGDNFRLYVWKSLLIQCHEASGHVSTRFAFPDGSYSQWAMPVASANVVAVLGNEIPLWDRLHEWLQGRGVTLWTKGPAPDPPQRVIDLIDFKAGRRTGTVPADSQEFQFSADGRTFANYHSEQFLDIWDVPLRPSRLWFLAVAVLLALPLAWLARRRVRRLRPAA